MLVNSSYSQYIYQSLSVISKQGNQFLPVKPSAQLISSSFVQSEKLCFTFCNTNTLCRIFDYEAIAQYECRLFEGDVNTLGSIISSSMPNSIVGIIQITSSLFIEYDQLCSSICNESRYLMCDRNSTCECMNFPIGIFLDENNSLLYVRDRENHRIQRWNKEATEGVTIAGSPDGISGTDPTKLNAPYRAIINDDETHMYVSDTGSNRILHFDLI